MYCLFTGGSIKAVKGGGEAKSQLDELGDLFGSMNAGSASSNHAADVRRHYTWCCELIIILIIIKYLYCPSRHCERNIFFSCTTVASMHDTTR